MSAVYRCQCTSFRCGETFGSSGEKGTLVNARTLRRHQQADRNTAISTAAVQAQEKALKDQQAALSKALEAMSLSGDAAVPGTTTPPSSLDRNKFDRIRRIAGHVGEVKSEVGCLLNEAENLGMAQAASNDKVITWTLAQLNVLENSAWELRTRLSTVAGKSKEPAIAALREATIVDLLKVEERVREIHRSWKDLRDHRDAQRHALLANGANVFDTGESLSAFRPLNLW